MRHAVRVPAAPTRLADPHSCARTKQFPSRWVVNCPVLGMVITVTSGHSSDQSQPGHAPIGGNGAARSVSNDTERYRMRPNRYRTPLRGPGTKYPDQWPEYASPPEFFSFVTLTGFTVRALTIDGRTERLERTDYRLTTATDYSAHY